MRGNELSLDRQGPLERGLRVLDGQSALDTGSQKVKQSDNRDSSHLPRRVCECPES